jgi:hypothetical protein
MVLVEASRLRVRWSTSCVEDARDELLVGKLCLLLVRSIESEYEC